VKHVQDICKRLTRTGIFTCQEFLITDSDKKSDFCCEVSSSLRKLGEQQSSGRYARAYWKRTTIMKWFHNGLLFPSFTPTHYLIVIIKGERIENNYFRIHTDTAARHEKFTNLRNFLLLLLRPRVEERTASVKSFRIWESKKT